MSKVISFRVENWIYNYFKNLNKPFTETIKPLLINHIKKMNNKPCIHHVCVHKKDDKYQRVISDVDEFIGHYFKNNVQGKKYEE
jgi:hypothetical protein